MCIATSRASAELNLKYLLLRPSNIFHQCVICSVLRQSHFFFILSCGEHFYPPGHFNFTAVTLLVASCLLTIHVRIIVTTVLVCSTRSSCMSHLTNRSSLVMIVYYPSSHFLSFSTSPPVWLVSVYHFLLQHKLSLMFYIATFESKPRLKLCPLKLYIHASYKFAQRLHILKPSRRTVE